MGYVRAVPWRDQEWMGQRGSRYPAIFVHFNSNAQRKSLLQQGSLFIDPYKAKLYHIVTHINIGCTVRMIGSGQRNF